jgi:hypothetical protein
MFTTLHSLSYRAGHHALCFRLPGKGGNVDCVVRSIARRSLFDCAFLVEIFTSAGASPIGPRPLAVRDASTRLRLLDICKRATRIRSVR